jgi:hypothetical protein
MHDDLDSRLIGILMDLSGKISLEAIVYISSMEFKFILARKLQREG